MTVAVAAALLSAVLLLVAVRRAYAIVTVRGGSMEPTLRDGDRLLVRRGRQPRHADVVVVRYPGRVLPGEPWTVKRVAALPGDPVPPGLNLPGVTVPADRLVVVGDNADGSYDSRGFGYAHADQLLGVVVRPLTARPAPR